MIVVPDYTFPVRYIRKEHELNIQIICTKEKLWHTAPQPYDYPRSRVDPYVTEAFLHHMSSREDVPSYNRDTRDTIDFA